VDQRRLGGSDVHVSVVGLGCNNFGGRLDFDRARAVVDAALEAGITFFDTADVYGSGGTSERFLGEILDGRRDDVVIATKFGHDVGLGKEPRGTRSYIRRALEASLERLRTDRIDLYYYHRPDGVTPLAETLGALWELVDEGRVRAVGCSNFSAAQLREAADFARASGRPQIAALQNRYNLLERDAEEEILPLCRELGISFVPYFPLASGVLTGKYRRGEPPPAGSRLQSRPEAWSTERLERVEELEAFAEERGHTLLELAIGALASRSEVASVIAGATTPEQARANAGALWMLTDDELATLADALR
jgi:aryl-alcohol dehydrogenase-like predicted oxidoreductase